jgi:hypothetical protein
LENKLVSNKGIIVTTLLVGILSAIVALFIHFDSDDEGLNTKDIKNEKLTNEEKKTVPSPSLKFTKVFVTPIDTKIPSSFFIEISNTGTASAIDFILQINFGESQAEICEYIPKSIVTDNSEGERSIKIINISSLAINQSFFAVCATNSPIFKSISVRGGNVEYDKKLTYEGYKNQLTNESISFYEGLLRTILGVLTAIFLFYLFCRLVKTLG